jgi:uncharacterized protein YPO0396
LEPEKITIGLSATRLILESEAESLDRQFLKALDKDGGVLVELATISRIASILQARVKIINDDLKRAALDPRLVPCAGRASGVDGGRLQRSKRSA